MKSKIFIGLIILFVFAKTQVVPPTLAPVKSDSIVIYNQIAVLKNYLNNDLTSRQ